MSTTIKQWYTSNVNHDHDDERPHRQGSNDETMFRHLSPRLETRRIRVSSPRLVFFLLCYFY